MKLNGKYGRIMSGENKVASISSWSGDLESPIENFEELGADGKDGVFLETTNLSVAFDGLREVGDTVQDAIFGNVVKVNSGTPSNPGETTAPTYAAMTLELYESDDRCWVGSFLVTPTKIGAEQGKLTPFSAKAESKGGVMLYTGEVVA